VTSPIPPLPPPETNAEIELRVERMAHEGVGVARCNGFVHFVEGGAPGDFVRARVKEVRKSFARSAIVEILAPSPDRVTPRCPFVGTCGGCHLQHLSTAAQVRTRETVLEETLVRLGRITEPVVDPTVTQDAWGTRHRVTLHLSRGRIGFVDTSQTEIVPIDACVIAHECFAPIIRALADLSRRGVSPEIPGGDIELRTGHPAGLVHVILGEGTEGLVQPLLNTVQCSSETTRLTIQWFAEGRWQRASTHRAQPLVLETPWATWRLPPKAFYQVYPPLAIEMAQHVRTLAGLNGDATALDLYSGIGFLAAAIARDAKHVTCLETSRAAVGCGIEAFRSAGLSNVSFQTGDVERALRQLPRAHAPRVVVLDPPRAGASRATLDGILRLGPERILYVSCDPATLARDLRHLIEGGYHHHRSIPFDLFPQTYHFESVTLLAREARP
jgi:23S rRNA (uracil1939-C5)-methyltransferase